MPKWNVSRDSAQWLMDSDGRVLGVRDKRGTDWHIPMVSSKQSKSEAQPAPNFTLPQTSARRRVILFGHSFVAMCSGNLTPTAVTYDQATGRLGMNINGHGFYSGQRVSFYARNAPGFNGDYTASVVDANNFALQVPIGLGAAPTAALTGLIYNSASPSRSFFAWLQLKSGHAFDLVRNAGVYGDTLDQMAARLDRDVLAYEADEVILMCCANDIVSAGAVGGEAAILSKLGAIIDRITGAGMVVRLVTDTPVGALKLASASWYNNSASILQKGFYSLRGPAVRVVDAYSLVVQANGSVKAGYADATDDWHPGAGMAERIGQALADSYSRDYLPTIQLPTSHLDARLQNAASKNLFRNPVFSSTAGGFVQNGVTGAAADRVGISSHPSLVGVASVVSSWAGVGNSQRVVVSAAAATQTLTLNLYADTAHVTGKRYRPKARVRISGVASNPAGIISGVQVQMYITDPGGTKYLFLQQVTSGALPGNSDLDLTFSSIDSLLCQGTVTGTEIIIVVTFGATLSSPITLDVAQVEVEELDA